MLEAGLQLSTIFFAEIGKCKGLKITLRRPHWKQHLGLASHRAVTYVENHFYLDSLIQRLLQVQQPAGDRQLV